MQYAAPRNQAFERQSCSKNRFDQEEQFRAQREKKKVIKQLYRVKKNGRKGASSDLKSNEEKPIKISESSATKGNDVKQSTVDTSNVKYEKKKLKISKIKKELPLFTSTSQPRYPLGLSRWQKKKLQNLSAQELKEKNLAWVPKRNSQIENKDDVSTFIAKDSTKVKDRRKFEKKSLGQRFAPNRQDLCSLHHPYCSYVQPINMSWTPFPGMCGYPPWPHFNPWSYKSYYQGGVTHI